MLMKHLKLIILGLIILTAILSITYLRSVHTLDNTKYCNAAQDNEGFIRYPNGAIGAWSTDMGEIGSVMSRVPRIYPCLDSIVVRPLSEDFRAVEDEWRDSVAGDPSMLTVKYRADKPSGATTTEITVSPHVSVFRVTFPEGAKAKYLVLEFNKPKIDPWAKLKKWTERTVTRIDDRTIQATINEPGKSGAFLVIKFDAPCSGSGIIDTTGTIVKNANSVSGFGVTMFVQFDVTTVTGAVAESYTSMNKAEEFLANEFTDFNTVHKNCHAAWKEILNRVEIEGTENSKRMAYSALSTIYANLMNGSDNSIYLKHYSNPRTLASSVYWQFIGGFHSCCWDHHRTAYPFLMLAYPELMSDIINTYLARYFHDGCVTGNICLYTGITQNRYNMRLSPVLISHSEKSGIEADYSQLYAALKDNFSDNKFFPESISKYGYDTQPPSGGKACSYTLEYSTGLHSMAMLAKANNDPESQADYLRMSKSYVNVWDSTQMAFRVKNKDGSWGIVDYETWTWNPNPQGLFEGTTTDWMFAVPHDPYGLINLPGQKRFVERVIDYCMNDTWFNDYQYNYPYLLYYAGAANEAQKIIRKTWVPLFKKGVMYEEVTPIHPDKTWKTHYTSNAGWLICSMIGLYPVNSPPGQYIITSPSITKATIQHEKGDVTIQAKNNTDDNIYIRSIKVDDKEYPCYMIPASRLVKGAKIELEMSSDSTKGLGDLYISSTDGYVQNAEMVSPAQLKCTIEAAIEEATTKIYSRTKPVKILINLKPSDTWNYDDETKIATIQNEGVASIEVFAE